MTALDGDRGRLTVDLNGKEAEFGLPRGVRVMDGTRVRRLGDVKRDAVVTLIFSWDRERLLAIDLR